MRFKHSVGSFALCVALVAAPAVCVAGTGPPATAQAKRIIAAFKSWASRWGIPNGSISVMNGTTLLGSGHFGNYSASKIEPVATESKAITAVCIVQLVESGQLSFKDSLGTLLKAYFKKNPPVDINVKTITIGQLLTHISGITYDPSQGSQGGAIEQLPHDKTNLTMQAQITFSKPLGYDPGTTYYYNNMNYALLGLIIETVTGQAYESHCGTSVLQPVGITDAKLNPSWRVMASWGGWKISANDYTKFLEYFLPSMHLLSIIPAQWPQYNLGGGAYYSLGTLMRQAGHFGRWQWNTDSFGGYFGVLQENVRYMAEYSPTISDAAESDLDASLYNAAVGAVSVTPGLAHGRTDLMPR